MDKSEKLWTVAGIGVAAFFGIAWLINSRNVTTTPAAGGGFQINTPTPSAAQIYEPGSIIVPGLNTNSTIGASPATNPGSSIIFNFNPGSTVPATSAGINAATAASGVAGSTSGGCAGGCGCGPANGVNGGCNCPDSGVQSFGSPQDLASSIAAVLGPAMTAAFNIGQTIKNQEALNTSFGGVFYSA